MFGSLSENPFLSYFGRRCPLHQGWALRGRPTATGQGKLCSRRVRKRLKVFHKLIILVPSKVPCAPPLIRETFKHGHLFVYSSCLHMHVFQSNAMSQVSSSFDCRSLAIPVRCSVGERFTRSGGLMPLRPWASRRILAAKGLG